jgi:predicted DsbA family dithiol-disulfide isomerase
MGADAGESPAPAVTLWTDFICPWAYAARPLTDWLRRQGADVTVRAYELHPHLPPEGRPIRPGGRLDAVLDHIAGECARAGQPFTKPTRSPNSRLALEVLELASAHGHETGRLVEAALSEAHWVRGDAIDDPDRLESILRDHLERNVVDGLCRQRSAGEGGRLVDAARVDALEVGVTATPGWRIGELTITGLHPADQFQRWAGRVLRGR